MKPAKIFFILSLLGILILMFLTQIDRSQEGTIKSVKYSENKITIQLENRNESLIIFNTPQLDLKPKDKISFQGKQEIYKQEKQIIVDKIIKES